MHIYRYRVTRYGFYEVVGSGFKHLALKVSPKNSYKPTRVRLQNSGLEPS